MDVGSQSNVADPGLFDTPRPSPSSKINAPTGGHLSARRVYRPVPEERRRSNEYRVCRERNNKAVQRCRANNKVKQRCLAIKSKGYRNLAQEYANAARKLEAERMHLEQLFRIRMTTGQGTSQLQALLMAEDISRLDFEEKVETIRREFTDQVQAVTDGFLVDASAAASCSSASPRSTFSSQSSLKESESQSTLLSSPLSSQFW
ncbi:unnamed protein product [Mesocestoides corti]|nr:unnamed protein product [Mesocestoides corti]